MESYLRRLQLTEITDPPFGVGAFIIGNILIIGEQASGPETAPNQKPFCSDKGCSKWLNRLLADEKIQEEKLFWINVLNNDGSIVDLKSFVGLLRPAFVISLGNVAHQECKQQVIEHYFEYHPQYWKRFKSNHRYHLLDLLSELSARIPTRKLYK